MKGQRDISFAGFLVVILVSAGLSSIYFWNYRMSRIGLSVDPVQQDAADWALASVLVSVIGLLATFGSLVFVYLTLRSQADALAIEVEPFLTVEFEEDGLNFENGVFTKEGKVVEELWFRLVNTGRAPVEVTQLCRRWSVTSGNPPEFPVDCLADQPQGAKISLIWKPVLINIGAGQKSGVLRARADLLRFCSPSGKPYFDGFVRYAGVDGAVEFATGFLFVFDKGRMHQALPSEGRSPQAYSYRRRVLKS
ncbi:hypothetical protein GOC54_09790 [Sinorhizobium meliloti]|nr:hypothetical protein [Sinorhizobium meliloti]